ncbi:MAG: ATP-binding cassette domain-containing protein [Anaerolineaceae bacterium]|nr:ATP-binding cassette domain-containing protein [Anaerolineaceae bacterium]
MSFIEIRDFSYTYPGRQQPALEGINLQVDRGQFLVITGKSGCGKSTLAKALAGFLFQDEVVSFTGEIRVNETDMTQVPLFAASERVAYVQQNPEDQFCTLTVKDEIAFGLENRQMPSAEIEAAIESALSIVHGIDLLDRDLATLSGGEKQKVAIASMLALSPDVLILDEPTSNLDPDATRQIFNTLHLLAEQQSLTIIIIEHKLLQIVDLAPQVLVMSQGKIDNKESVLSFLKRMTAELDSDQLDNSAAKSTISKEPLLSLAELNLTIRNKTILNGINLDLYPGEFIGLMGPNGSGKTSLLLTIMGLIEPTAGSKFGFGHDLSHRKISDLVREMGFIFQNPDHQLFTASIREEALFTLENLGLLTPEKEVEAMAWLTKMGLAEELDRHPQSLSYGEKRRLNLVSLILHNPEILLIDEMLIGQDLENARLWMKQLKAYCEQGNTVLLVNHHPVLTSRYCDRVVFLDQGEIQVNAPTTPAFQEIANRGYQAFIPQAVAGGQIA